MRTQLSDATTFAVSPDDEEASLTASDIGPCSFPTIQAAYDFLVDEIDTASYPVKLKVADGVYPDGFVSRAPLVGGGKLIIEGNLTTPAKCSVPTSGAHCFQTLAGDVIVRGFKVSTTGAFNCLDVPGGHLAWDRIEFGPSGSNHVQAYLDGSADCWNGSYAISGGAGAHLHCYGGGRLNLNSTAVALLNTPAFRDSFVGVASAIAGFARVSFSGSATGRRYYVHKNGIIDIGGDSEGYFPGTLPGIRSGGGKYIGEPEGRQLWPAQASAGVGALGATPVLSRYQRSEGYVDVDYFINPLSAGSGSGALVLILPFPATGTFTAIGHRLNDATALYGSGDAGYTCITLFPDGGGNAILNGASYRVACRYPYQ
jgi:hypothetical protein